MASYPMRFKDTAEMEAYLSIASALDGDRRLLVQRRRRRRATKKEYQLIDNILLDTVRRPKTKIKRAMRLDRIAFDVLLEQERQRRHRPAVKQGLRELAKTEVGERLKVTQYMVDTALKQFVGEKLTFATQLINDQLDLVERIKRGDTPDPADFDLDARVLLAPCLDDKI
jgi:hypothetical protein